MAIFDNVMNDVRDNIKADVEKVKVETEKIKEAAEQTVYTVNTNRSPLNCRKGPGSDHAVVGSFAKDSKVKLIEKTNDEWYLVTNDEVEGYAFVKYLKED